MAPSKSKATTTGSATNIIATPAVVRDPRFRAGRKLVQTGQAANAIDIFADLLAECRRVAGDESLDACPAYYEYGNALFRDAQHQQSDDAAAAAEEAAAEPNDLNPREAAALAAERRVQGPAAAVAAAVTALSDSPDDAIIMEKEETPTAKEEAEDTEDIQLALEMMETAWSILDYYSQPEKSNDATATATANKYHEWVTEQTPRVLTGIGDVLSALHRHADAADAYSRALAYRQEQVSQFAPQDTCLEFLQARRRAVEVNVLIAEELLACAPGVDVVTTESHQLVVSAAERVDYARGYYDKARDELQETVLLMGQIAAVGGNVSQEKEDVCFVATLVMGVGTALAELDEEVAAAAVPEPSRKKAKKV